MNQHIPLSSAPIPFTPKCLGVGTAVVILVKPMTQADFDRLGFELFRHNISPVTQDTFRATMIDEIFNLYGDAEGEEKACLMDEFWQGEDLFGSQMEEWRIREADRLWDEGRGAPPRRQEPLPQRVVPLRRRTQAQLFSEKLRNESRRMRDLTIEMQGYEPRQREGITRLVVEGWTGVAAVFEKPDGIVTDRAFDALKAEIGKAAIDELHSFVMSLGNIDEVERGNSDSLLENASDQNGSLQLSDGSASSDGNSPAATTGQTEPGMPIPVSGSEEITGSSSTSTSSASGESQNCDPSPTVEA